MRNFVAILTTLVLMFSSTLFPHQQSIHQYITREAFQLLIRSHPQLASSEMATYVGNNQTSTPYDRSWGAGKIVSGAWIEDEYDIVYHYGIGRNPTFNQWTANAYYSLFSGGAREAFTSITHFWDADNGDNSTINIPNDLNRCPLEGGKIPNAYWKAMHYVNGNWVVKWKPPDNTTITISNVEEMKKASADRGHWIGGRIGVQTNGGDIADRWSTTLMYEWKYSNTFSLPIELQLFRHRAYAYDEFGEYGKVLETRPIVSIGLKARLTFWRLSPYAQIGLEYLSGSGFFLATPNYASGIEVFLSDKIVLYTNIRKSIVPDYYHFISLGINFFVVPFIH